MIKEIEEDIIDNESGASAGPEFGEEAEGNLYNKEYSKPVSSVNGMDLEVNENGELYCPHDRQLYEETSPGKFDPIQSSVHGGSLYPNENGDWYSPDTNDIYEKTGPGKYEPIQSATHGGSLERKEDGKLYSPDDGGEYQKNENGQYVPVMEDGTLYTPPKDEPRVPMTKLTIEDIEKATGDLGLNDIKEAISETREAIKEEREPNIKKEASMEME